MQKTSIRKLPKAYYHNDDDDDKMVLYLEGKHFETKCVQCLQNMIATLSSKQQALNSQCEFKKLLSMTEVTENCLGLEAQEGMWERI